MGVDMQMVAKTKQKITKKKLLELSFDLAERFGTDSFYIWRPGDTSFYKEGRHCLEILNKNGQKDYGISCEEGETCIDVNVASRYYGEGYERGDIMLAIGIAEFLENKLSNTKILMGGDSGEGLEDFDKTDREKIKEYFFREGHLPYRTYGSRGDFGGRYCDFCEHQMNQYGFGGKYAAFICYGCGLKEETRDSGDTWQDVTKVKTL